MTIQHILLLIGGLSLFLYGMHMMSVGLEAFAGNKMKGILEKLTNNPIIGVLVGTIITAIIQSSSATTVMVVGFVNSGIMTLRQAVWVIMGANIGTTITGQLVALDVGEIAPLFACIGVVMAVFVNDKKLNHIGEVIAGLGILFIGMNLMSESMLPLQDSPTFIHLLTTISNPFLAVIVGTLFTALIQSSSASVGILQTLANSGLIPLSSSIYIIFGQNIGTCITAILAALSANRNAKRTTIIHLAFNIIGTLIFMVLIQGIPFVDWIVNLTDNPAAQIAHTHTIFNVISTLIFLPFGHYLAKLAETLLPITEQERNKNVIPLTFVNDNSLGNTSIAITSLKKEALYMLELTKTNLNDSLQILHKPNIEYYEKILKREKQINHINYEISNYMSKVSLLPMNQQESDICNSIYKCFSDIERIGDHAMNIASHAINEEYHMKQLSIVQDELKQLQELLNHSYKILLLDIINDEEGMIVLSNEDRINELTDLYRRNQIHRLKEGSINAVDCVIYSQIMTDIERISDHMKNIIQERQKYLLN